MIVTMKVCIESRNWRRRRRRGCGLRGCSLRRRGERVVCVREGKTMWRKIFLGGRVNPGLEYVRAVVIVEVCFPRTVRHMAGPGYT